MARSSAFNKYSNSNSKRRLIVLVSAVLTLAALAYFWFRPSADQQRFSAFIKATDLIEAGEAVAAQKLLATAITEPQLAPWVYLTLGDLFANSGELSGAEELYLKVNSDSAAYPDSQLSLLRLLHQQDRLTDEDIDILSKLAADLLRDDILSALEFFKAFNAHKHGDIANAIEQLISVRKKYPRSTEIDRAQSLTEQLMPQISQEDKNIYVKLVRQHAKLLSTEGKPEAGLDALQKLQRELMLSGESKYQTLLIKEFILRRLGRHEEADKELLAISSEGELGSADIALLKIAKNAWNVNDHHRALMFIDRMKERFGNSPILLEALYVEARVLEEIQHFSDARDLYSQIASQTQLSEYQLHALQRLAWMYLREHNLNFALTNFQRLFNSSKSILDNDKSDAPLRRLARESIQHAAYWLLHINQTLIDAEEASSLNLQELDLLRAAIQQEFDVNYYQLLAQKNLKDIEHASNEVIFPDISEACKKQQITNFERQSLSQMSHPNLAHILKREIEWLTYKTALVEGSDAIILKRILLFNEFSLTADYLRLAIKLFINRDESDAIKQCIGLVNRFRYPKPYLTSFQYAAKQTAIPLELLLAVARTESYFDEKATSHRGAAGLMQLMPSTAERFGLTANIYKPDENILVGAKYLAHLMQTYRGEKTYALAAYNAGSSAVNRWRARYPELEPVLWVEQIGYPETKEYVKRVLSAEESYRLALKLSE